MPPTSSPQMHPWLLLLRSDGKVELLPGPSVRLYLRDIVQIAAVSFALGWWIA